MATFRVRRLELYVVLGLLVLSRVPGHTQKDPPSMLPSTLGLGSETSGDARYDLWEASCTCGGARKADPRMCRCPASFHPKHVNGAGSHSAPEFDLRDVTPHGAKSCLYSTVFYRI